MTKQEQKNEAYKAYEAIKDPADKTYKAIINPAFKAYLAKCEEIDAQEDEIKIIDGKRYKLIN